MRNDRYDVHAMPLDGLKRVVRKRIGDERGYLERLYCDDELQAAGFTKPVRQINRTLTRQRGAIRGFHFQRPPYAEAKYVSCLRGAIFDVAVDIRRGSPTFLRWYGEVLSEENACSFYIPEGFAHGLQTLTDEVEMLYLHTESYMPNVEGGLSALDPRLDVAWPLAVGPMSQRDRNHPLISSDFTGIEL